MKTNYSKLTSIALCALAAATFAPALRAAELNANDKKFLTQYEQVRAALAADDLAQAQQAATDLGEEGNAVAKSDKIATARTEFAKLSDHAVKLAAGQSGYYVANCPMLKKDWVQTNDKISNPYGGKDMLTCGSIKK